MEAAGLFDSFLRSPMPGSVSSHDQSALFEGGYYSIVDGETFSVAKVLKLEEETVHIRLYKQLFLQRPRSIDPGALTLGTIHDEDGFGMAHVPLRLTAFMEHQPMFLTYAEVKPEELYGYNFWKESADRSLLEF
jgi:hypothetical protein